MSVSVWKKTAKLFHQLLVFGNMTIMDNSNLFLLEASDDGLAISFTRFSCGGVANLTDSYSTKIRTAGGRRLKN